MSFVLAKKLKVKWPVTVRVPTDGGSYHEQKFTAHFEILANSRVDELPRDQIDVALLTEAFVGCDGVKDIDGNDVPFDDEVKALMIDRPDIRLGLIKAYNEAVVGRRGKN